MRGFGQKTMFKIEIMKLGLLVMTRFKLRSRMKMRDG